MEKIKLDFNLILQWDVAAWKRAVLYWDAQCRQKAWSLREGLELGARDGSLSYYFAKRYGSRMHCTDYEGPTEYARQFHEKEGVAELIKYASADARELPYADNTFDFVVFKSMLGVVGSKGRYHLQQKAMKEMHRVLKPGGVLLFAENARASALHQWARRQFVPWGNSWRYVSYAEMEELLSFFSAWELKSTGFFSAFVPRPVWLNNLIAHLDVGAQVFPKKWRYILYGYGLK